MEELSTPEMLSLRGGFDLADLSANISTVISAGNVAVAVPINLAVLSGNAVGSGSQATLTTIQNAEANAGNISASIAQLA